MTEHSGGEATEAQAPDEEPELNDTELSEALSDGREDDGEGDYEEDEDADLEQDESLITEDADEDVQASGEVRSSGNIDADVLNVNIDFNLGRGMARIADLRALAPGYIFTLEEEPGAEVAIIAGGQQIGRGEIVQVAERLGVRIVSLKGGVDA